MISVYFSAVKANVLQQLAYKGEFLLRNISLVIFIGIFAALWQTAYRYGGYAQQIGYQYEDMVWYLATTEAILLARSQLWGKISQEIKSGEIAYAMSKPYTYPLFELAASFGESLFRFILNIVIASLCALVLTGTFIENPLAWGMFGVMAIFSLVIDAGIGLVIGILSFFFEEVEPVYWVYDKILYTLGGLFFPIEIFPDFLKKIAEILPFKTILYLPAKSLIKFNLQTSVEGFAQQAIVLASLFLLVVLLWSVSVRKVTIHGG